MKILFVDTTTADLVVAVVEDSSIHNFSKPNCGTRHSETLCLCVEEAMNSLGLTFGQLDAFACAVGPGSFTGIRIGVSTVKGYALATEKPIIAINSLEAIAVSDNCKCCHSAVIDAGNGYYFADYAAGVEPCLVSYDDARANAAGKCSGAADCLDGAASLIRKKFAQGNFDSELVPVYIRRSQAEERR